MQCHHNRNRFGQHIAVYVHAMHVDHIHVMRSQRAVNGSLTPQRACRALSLIQQLSFRQSHTKQSAGRT